MNRMTLSALALVSAAVLAGPALAADAPVGKTREQVKAELAEAIRLGDMPADNETGRKLNEVYPHLYPKKAAPVAKTRQQVKDELSRALRDGTMPVYEGA